MTEPQVELIDAGDGRRLERFGARIVDRPHPAAAFGRRDPDAWDRADLRFDRAGGWTGAAVALGPWTIEVDALRLLLRPAAGGQIGYFPEHLAAARRVAGLAAARGSWNHPLRLLNLFGYTGLVTLAAAAAGAEVVHVDASRTANDWARTNAAASALGMAPIRWIAEDAATFVAREVRRARRYDGVVMDPPSYGHGGTRRSWRIERDLGDLLAASASLLDRAGGFLHVSSHTPALEGDRLARLVGDALGVRQDRVEVVDLSLQARSGAVLILGTAAMATR